MAFALSSRVLGVMPAAPGFARCRIQPRLGTLAWARGTVPTPRGDVRVAWEQAAGGTLRFDLELPGDLPADLVLPRPAFRLDLIVNGQCVLTDDQPVGPSVHIEAATVSVVLPGGTCHGELHRAKEQSTQKGNGR